MKAVLLIIFTLLYCTIQAATYYVSNTGNNTNSGLTKALAWQTLNKINSTTFSPGDNILFQKGNTFYGLLMITSSGNSANPIIFSSYGKGANPVITGFTTILGWINEGGGIYSKIITSEGATNMVTVDGINTGMGKTPNTGYFTYESCNANVSITDTQPGISIVWTGAEAVIRKNDWSLDRCLITKHIHNTITYTSLGTGWKATAGNGYFIQNDLRTLDHLGEWYHNPSTGKFYMYFGAVIPTSKTVKVATLNNNILESGAKYVAIENLNLTGSISSGVFLPLLTSMHVSIRNCQISFAGETGIRIRSPYLTADNNTIMDCNTNGVEIQASNAEITNNTIIDIGTIKGLSKYYSQGIVVNHVNNILIQYNRIENTGYNGIFIHGNFITVKNNFINKTCLTLNDGGGIYTDDTAPVAMLIEGNIVLNAVGNIEGGETPVKIAEGIYLDEYASGITVKNNTIAYCAYSGIKLHKAHDNLIQNNTCYGNYTGLYLLNSSTTESPMINNSILNNTFVSDSKDKHTMFIRDSYNTRPHYGTSNNNYFIKIASDTHYPIFTSLKTKASTYRTLSQWQAYTGQDVGSQESTQSIPDAGKLFFVYNPTKTSSTVTLDQTMMDKTGVFHSDSITIPAFGSMVLIKTGSTPKIIHHHYNTPQN